MLEDRGCTTARLREIFTALGDTPEKASGEYFYNEFLRKQGGEEKYLKGLKLEGAAGRKRLRDLKKFHADESVKRHKDNKKIRTRIERRIANRFRLGLESNCKNSQMFQAVDMVWDSPPITKWTVSAMLYAQGKINVEIAAKEFEKLGVAKDFCVYDEKDNSKIVGINAPKLFEVTVNLVRSYITRRHAAQTARFKNLWPYYLYEARGTRDVDKLRADVLSQRVDIMADQFGYRRKGGQSIRRQFLYGHVVSFVAKGWTKERGWEEVEDKKGEEFKNSEPGKTQYKDVTIREGVEFIDPHPTRIFWDTSQPLSAINVDLGPTYIGYWDVVPYNQIKNNPSSYWNHDKIAYSDAGGYKIAQKYANFFNYYYADSCTINTVPSGDTTSIEAYKVDFTAENDRKMDGYFGAEEGDQHLFLVQYYEKINPKTEGIADYPFDVWVRYVTTGDGTVVGGEFLSSIPAAFGGLNFNDDRRMNISPAHELMPFQDQITNILSQVLLNMKTSMLTIYAIDQDYLSQDQCNEIKAALKAQNYYTAPVVMFYSNTKKLELEAHNIIPGQRRHPDVIKAIRADSVEKVSEGFRAIAQLLSIVERLMVLSPQELGQPAPREISALEAQEISASVNTIYEFIADDIDEHRSALKKIIYESLIGNHTEGEDMMPLPVKHNYTRETLRAAGFKILGENGKAEELPERGTPANGNGSAGIAGIIEESASEPEVEQRQQFTVIGNVSNLALSVNFSSKDGGDRASNPQAAQVLTQLLTGLFRSARSMPRLLDMIGEKQIAQVFNSILRLSGVTDVKIETDQLNGPPELASRVTQMEQILDQIIEQASGGGGGGGAQPTAPGRGDGDVGRIPAARAR